MKHSLGKTEEVLPTAKALMPKAKSGTETKPSPRMRMTKGDGEERDETRPCGVRCAVQDAKSLSRMLL